MKILVLLSLLFQMNLGLAQGLAEVDIQNLSGQYSQGTGSATATFWDLPEAPGIRNAQFSVVKEQDSFLFSGDGGDFSIEGLPDLILKMKTLSWRAANFATNTKGINLKLQSLSGISSLQSLAIQDLSAQCSGANQSDDTLSSVMQSCLKKASLGFSSLEVGETGRSANWMKTFLTAILTNEAASKTRLEKLQLNISNNSFDLRVKAKLDISATIKAEGRITYKPAGPNAPGEIRLRLDKAKASFLNIKKKVFEAIEDDPIDGVRVERPFIIIDID